MFLSYDNRSGLESTDQGFTATADKRPLFVGTRFEGRLFVLDAPSHG